MQLVEQNLKIHSNFFINKQIFYIKNIACEKAVRKRVVLNNVFISSKSRCKVMIQVRELKEMLGK